MQFLYNIEILRALRLKSSEAFLNAPQGNKSAARQVAFGKVFFWILDNLFAKCKIFNWAIKAFGYVEPLWFPQHTGLKFHI